MLLSEDDLFQPSQEKSENRISTINYKQIKIDPFAPVVVKSFTSSTNDTPILIPNSISHIKALKEFKTEGKILNNSIIVDNCVGNSELQSDFDLAKCRSLFSKTFRIEEIENLDEMLMGKEDVQLYPKFASASLIGSVSTQNDLTVNHIYDTFQ